MSALLWTIIMTLVRQPNEDKHLNISHSWLAACTMYKCILLLSPRVSLELLESRQPELCTHPQTICQPLHLFASTCKRVFNIQNQPETHTQTYKKVSFPLPAVYSMLDTEKKKAGSDLGKQDYKKILLFLLTSDRRCLSWPGCFFANNLMTSGVLKASLMAAWMASCILLSSLTRVMSPPFILVRDSLNSLSCSRVSRFVSSYSSGSRSSLLWGGGGGERERELFNIWEASDNLE